MEGWKVTKWKSSERLQNVSGTTDPFSLFTDAEVEADSKHHVKTLNYAQRHIKSTMEVQLKATYV